ncbi:unnamed protein product [Paramecium primaurelia]|uniref:Protein kinase domain-containing protein n=1 Tax=Paramecium primaurelia TaxID=5886 RepID=A0A8S1MH41_PARPR|nr:unnamed protein product [Paramecium primaurelia]
MESLALIQYQFHSTKDINEEYLKLIQELNDEVVYINYVQNIMIYSFPSYEYINLKDLLFFKDNSILAISQSQLILISIQILESLKKLQEFDITHNDIKTENIWIWVSKPLSSKLNNQIEFKAYFSRWNKVSKNIGLLDKIDFYCVKKVIKEIFQQDNQLNKLDFNIQQNVKQIIQTLSQYKNQYTEEQQKNGLYDYKTIEIFLQNRKLSDEEFKKQFGQQNGQFYRNILLNWAIKHQKLFINSQNCTQLSIQDLAKELNIDGWFLELFKELKQNTYLEDYLFYTFQVEEALNDIKQIQNSSSLATKINCQNLIQSIQSYENNLYNSLFPKISKFCNNMQAQNLTKSYREIINEIIDQCQLIITSFYKNSHPIIFPKILIYRFFKQGLNILDDYLSTNQIDIITICKNSQSQKQIINQVLDKFLKDQIINIFLNFTNKENRYIANQLFYNETNIY